MTDPLTRADWEARRARAANSSWLRNALQGWRDPALVLTGHNLSGRQRIGGIGGVLIAAVLIVAIYLVVPAR